MIYSGFWAGVASAMLCLAAAIAIELVSPATRYSLGARLFGVTLCLTGTILVSFVIPPLKYLWERLGVPPVLHLHIGFFAAVIASIVLMDFLSYWRHRLLHFAFFWRFHALHHSATELHAANSYAHFLEGVPNLVVVLIPVSLIDFGGVEVPMAALLFLSMLQFYIHSPVTIQLGIVSFTHPLTIDRLLAPFERIGRAVMDIGFSGFLEKFEDHFGRGWTKVLLILIGLAVSSVCLAIIWRYLFSPILQFFQAPGHLEMMAKITTAGAAIAAGGLIALRTYDWYLGRKLDSRAESRAALQAQIKATETLLDSLDKRAAERRARREGSK